ncbi:glycosyltransferase family protein [Gallaecimonas kandeliae]|uniref:MJ1255/VC2487 family glycosyltransferase n=1 Tax=Gallaecimonas kandeliae TaxID=3029055 RepID=UPI00264962D6|nr:MJ1255/VC2487 family glycosyltransferase [Gallaecimonas kandeliae]WKE65339.1 glycosyltransferase family protein [Gallaecimonas kandeliae]
MRILYGVQGTGNGHITRARVMAAELAKRDVQVDFLFSGRPASDYFDMEPFGDYQTRSGLTFATERGRVSLTKTLRQSKLRELYQDIKALPVKDYDLVINDFEPITAWAAKLAKVPSIGVSHQASFLKPVPRDGEDWSARLLIRHFAPVGLELGVHWYHFGHAMLPPIIERHSHDQPVRHNKVLVYLPFESVEEILALLEPFPDVEFYCYHPQVQDEDRGHIHLRAPSRSGFPVDLAESVGVIANGGFELPSEALRLGKKLLLKPLHGQFEQLSNVLTLRQLGLASAMYELSASELDAWLELPPAQPVSFPDVAASLVDWLLAGNRDNFGELCQGLWRQVAYPSYCKLSAGPVSN